jgi:hypothetical protein
VTLHQKRRLDKLAARLAPCIGCLQEELWAAESLFPGLGDKRASARPSSSTGPTIEEIADLRVRLRATVNQQRGEQGLDPLPDPAPDPPRKRMTARELLIAKQRLHEARTALRVGMASGANQRPLCPKCTYREAQYEQIRVLSARLAEVSRSRANGEDLLPGEERLDGPFD